MSRVRALANAAMQRTAAQQKNVKEAAESIDELSTNKLLNYRAAATKQLGKTSPETEQKRKAGLATSGTKIKSQLKKEDYESIDELSKDTLGSYIKKASVNAAIKRRIAADVKNSSQGVRNPLRKATLNAMSKDLNRDSRKRQAGIGKAVDRLTKEDAEWDWDAIFDAPEHEIDTMIDEMSDQDLDSFVSEFEQIEEGSNWYQGSTNSTQPSDGMGREKLKPRAEADAAFADAHTDNVKVTDYPGKNDQHQAKMPQAPARPGDKRNSEAKKTLSDMRSGKK
jgi:hypothetical protein